MYFKKKKREKKPGELNQYIILVFSWCCITIAKDETLLTPTFFFNH